MERYCVVLQDDNGQRAGRMPLIDVLPQMLERLGISVDALRSLLTQPAPADVADVPQPDWDTAPKWAQWWAVDECGAAWWYAQKPVCRGVSWRSNFGDYKEDVGDKTHPAWRDSLAYRPQALTQPPSDVAALIADRDAWRDIARGMSPASPDVAALDAAKQRAELQLADARQEIEALQAANADMYRTMTEACTAAADAGEEVCRVRAELVDARRLQSEYRSEWIAASTRANVALNERDTALNERDAARQDYKLTDTALAAANWQRDLLSRQMADMEQERAELTADRDEWRETAQSSAHKVAVAREALGAE